MRNICVIGAGHVGLVTSACLAEMGNKVVCVDDDVQKVESLRNEVMPFHEPGLEGMVFKNVNEGRLSFTTSVEQGVRSSQIIFIAVGTPQKPNGEVDLTSVERVSQEIAAAMDSYIVVVEKSTVPVKTGSWLKTTIRLSNVRDVDFDIVCNPEFLREGSAIRDFMGPDRIVIGVESERAANIMTELYRPLDVPIIITNLETAEIIKHASNCFLALKISYINAIANICENAGVDVVKVAEGMGYDKRIGREFLNAGVGYGGYCLPKDVSAFIKVAEELGYDFELLKVVQKINKLQRQHMVEKLGAVLGSLDGKTVGILGLSFKPNTDDMRGAPSIDIIRRLQGEGARIKVYDPNAMEDARAILSDIEYCGNPYEVAEGSDALLLVTEWDEFKQLDLLKIRRLLKQPVVVDGRNVYDPEKMKEFGFIYQGVGR